MFREHRHSFSYLLWLARIVTGGKTIPCHSRNMLTREVGAYLLLIRLKNPIFVSISRKMRCHISSGFYVYSGSAYGAGGIRARVSRHFHRNKTVHWHIDHLTQTANDLYATIVPRGNECVLLGKMLDQKGIELSIPGFGSSDCHTCKTHLLKTSHP